MSKSRDRDKKFALACGLGVLAVVALIVLSWDGLHSWYVGYRFVWLPEGAKPIMQGRSINMSGGVAVNLRTEPLSVRAGRWSLATREVLPLDFPQAASQNAMVLAINDAGDMVGLVSRDHGVRPFLWTKHDGVMDLATLIGEEAVATAINERGQVAGWLDSSPSNASRAFLWSAESGIVELGLLAPGQESQATAINETGYVVGSATVADGSDHPFLWKPATGMVDLGLPSGFLGGVAGPINDQGEVLVSFYTKDIDGFRLYTPFVWREEGGLVKLPAPRAFDNVWGLALNNRGTVLLDARPSDPSLDSIGYLIVNGVLKELPGAPKAKSTQYSDLNDKGWLLGFAETKAEDASWRMFVALPVR